MSVPPLFGKAEPADLRGGGADGASTGGASESRSASVGAGGSPGGGGGGESGVPAAPPHVWELPFAMQPQEQINWCWAAVAASVAQFYNAATAWAQQHAVAQAVLGLPNCCQQGGCPACDIPRRLSEALNHTGNLDHFQPHPFTFPDVRDSVWLGHPMCARVEAEGIGHFVVVSGYNAGLHWITVQDPSPCGLSFWPFQEFLSHYQHAWHCTHAYWTQC